jgi:hypothetical protein
MEQHPETDPLVIGRKIYRITLISAIVFALAAYLLVS